MKSARLRTSLACWVTLVLLAGAAHAGVFYRAETTVESSAQSKTNRTTVKAWIDGDKAKILFMESENPMTAQGSYMLTQDGGKTLLLVNPQERTYSELDLEAMIGMVGSMSSALGGMVDFEFSEPEVEILVEESGGEILGFETRHYKVRSQYGVKMKILGMKRASETETLQDMWVTDELQDAAMGVWLRKDPPRTGDENLDQIIAAEVGKVKGFPLRSRAVSTTMSGRKGKRKTTTTTSTEVVQLEQRKIEAKTFELPEGYTKTELMPEGTMNPFKAARQQG